MPILHTWKQDEALFAIWHVTETTEELRAMLSTENSTYDDDLQHLKSVSRQLEYIATRVLLAHLCSEEKRIDHLPSGKPFLTDGSFRISISHTHGYVAIALHPNQEVGIDIEYVADRVMKVTDRFLSSNELAMLPSSATNRRTCALLCWSAKETAFKVLGAEGVDLRDHLHILPFKLTLRPVLQLYESRTTHQKKYCIHGSWNDHFVCTWCIAP